MNSKKAKELRRIMRTAELDQTRDYSPSPAGPWIVLGPRADYRKAKAQLRRRGVA